MSGTVVIGAQWGDEGKGKIVDFLSRDAEFVVRYQGGANAGHSLKINGKKIVTHLLPAGIVNSKTTCILGDGVVINLDLLQKEISYIEEMGYKVSSDRLKISSRAHITLPSHIKIDTLLEIKRADAKIGTTKRGIGPTYEDKISRRGLRLGDLLNEDNLAEKLKVILDDRNHYIKYYLEEAEENFEYIYNNLLEHAKWIKPYIDDTSLCVYNAIKEDKKVLFEGAQGVMLDIDAGTYPYVTSSNTVPGYVSVGAGIPHKMIGKVIAVVKAYTTRVGEGPFPTEDNTDLGELMRFQGGEYGATTGRPRRCGWLDLVALKYVVRRTMPDYIALTKLDVFSGFPEIKVATAYRLNGKILDKYPSDYFTLSSVEPVYTSFKSWNEDISSITSIEELPNEAQNLIRWLEKELNTKILLVSVGPERQETITINNRV